MNEFDNEEIILSQYSSQTNGQIAPMAEHCIEAAAVQVRILFCPQTLKHPFRGWGQKTWKGNNGEN